MDALLGSLSGWLQPPASENHDWPRPPVGPASAELVVSPTPDFTFGGLGARLLTDWWANAVYYARYANPEPYDGDSDSQRLRRGHLALPPIRVAEGYDTTDIIVSELHTGDDRAVLRELKRIAMAEGFTSVTLDPITPEAYMRTLDGQYGWTDVLCNRNAGLAAPSPPRPLSEFPELLVTWSPPATRLWARMTKAERGAWAGVLRWASAVQDWLAQPQRRPGRFYWEDVGSNVPAALLFVAPLDKAPEWSRIHGLNDTALAAAGANARALLCLHVRALRIDRGDADGKLLALINAFLVEMARSRTMHLTLDAHYVPADAWDPDRLLYLGHKRSGGDAGFVYPTWQQGMGPWPFFYSVPTPPRYAASSHVFFAPMLPNTGRPLAHYADREAIAVLSDMHEEVAGEDQRERVAELDRGSATDESERPAKRPRLTARCFMCQRLHARTTNVRLAPPRLCSTACHEQYREERGRGMDE